MSDTELKFFNASASNKFSIRKYSHFYNGENISAVISSDYIISVDSPIILESGLNLDILKEEYHFFVANSSLIISTDFNN